MPGIESCRLCGDCCVGCIFLFYDDEKDVLGCLIHNNKRRRLVKGWNVAYHFRKGRQRNLELFFRELESIIDRERNSPGPPSGMCDSYQCWSMEKNRIVQDSIRESSVFRSLMLAEAKIQQEYRNFIPEFEELVRILNL